MIGVKVIVLLLALGMAALAGDRVEFSEGAYSLEFPQGWKKAKAPAADAEFARESPDEGVLVAVQCDKIPEGAAADLDGMAKTAAESYAKAIQFKGEVLVSDGELDGCRAKFLTLAPQKEEDGPIGMFAVFVDARKHFIRITATMMPELDKETRDACLGIVKSFRREEPKKE